MNQDVYSLNSLVNGSILAASALVGFVFLARNELISQYKTYKEKREKVYFASEEIDFDLERLSGDYWDNLARDPKYFGNLVNRRKESLVKILKETEINQETFYGILMNGPLNKLHQNIGKMENFLKEVNPNWNGFKLN